MSLKPGPAATAIEIIAFCQGKVARYKLSKAVGFSEDIARNSSGKIFKRLLREAWPAAE